MSGPFQAESPNTNSSEQKLLDRFLIRGIAWTGGVKWASQIISWVGTIVVVRLLVPSDYGLFAMAASFLGLVALVNELGLGSAIVMVREVAREQIAQVNTLAILLGVLGFGFTCAVASPLGEFYKAPDLPLALVVMGCGFVIAGFRSVPGAMLERELRFKLLALIEAGQAMVSIGVTLWVAMLGYGYWALIAGNLSGIVAGAVFTVIAHPQGFLWPRGDSLRGLMRLSWHLLGSRVSWYVASSSDLFVVGRVLGQGTLGIYSFGSTLANLPIEKVTSMVNRVTPAFFSSVQAEHARLRRYVLGLTEGLAFVIFPIAAGMAVVADDFVLLALGAQWASVADPLRVLAVCASMRAMAGLIAPLLYVTGNSRLGLLNGLWCLIIFPLGFYVGSYWGVMGVATAWLLVYPFCWAAIYWKVFQAIALRFRDYVDVIVPALSGVIAMALVVAVVKSQLPPDFSLHVRFAFEILAGAMVYIGILLTIHKHRFMAFASLVRSLRASHVPS